MTLISIFSLKHHMEDIIMVGACALLWNRIQSVHWISDAEFLVTSQLKRGCDCGLRGHSHNDVCFHFLCARPKSNVICIMHSKWSSRMFWYNNLCVSFVWLIVLVCISRLTYRVCVHASSNVSCLWVLFVWLFVLVNMLRLMCCEWFSSDSLCLCVWYVSCIWMCKPKKGWFVFTSQ